MASTNKVLTILLQEYAEILEPDSWMMYIYMQCPTPEIHSLAGYCPDCENKYFELEGIQNRVDICKLSLACRDLYSIRN